MPNAQQGIANSGDRHWSNQQQQFYCTSVQDLTNKAQL